MLDTSSLQTLIQTAKNRHEKYLPSFNELTRSYLGKYRNEVMEFLRKRNKSHIFIPVLPSKTRRILASFQESYFSNEDIVKIEQVLEVAQLAPIVDKIQEAFNHYTQKEMKLFNLLSSNMLEAIIYGTPIMRVYWAGDKPKLENINIYDVFLDPDATSNEDLNYLVHNIYLSKAQILNYIELGIFTPENEIQKETDISRLYKREKLQEVYYKINNQWYLATLLENNKLRDIPLNDGMPFVIGNLIPQIREYNEEVVRLYGDSPIAIILGLQQEINTRRNQQIDAIDLSLNPRVLMDLAGGIDPLAFKKGAGEIIACNDPNSVKFFTPPSINEGTFDVQRLDLEAQEALGVTAYNSGTNSQMLNNTATGISVLSAEANTRIQSLIRSYNETFIEVMFARLASLIYKYDTKFLGDLVVKPPLELIATINTGLGATNKQVQLQSYEKAFAMFAQIQNYQGMVRIVQDMLPLLGIKNKEDYFVGGNNNGANTIGANYLQEQQGIPIYNQGGF